MDGQPWFLSMEVPGTANARTLIRLVTVVDGLGRFEIDPVTGKRHQIRLHMTSIGCPIVNDPLYPVLRPEPKMHDEPPLQLLSRRLAFTDPITGADLEFVSKRRLALWP